jgi:hypothetical protein
MLSLLGMRLMVAVQLRARSMGPRLREDDGRKLAVKAGRRRAPEG